VGNDITYQVTVQINPHFIGRVDETALQSAVEATLRQQGARHSAAVTLVLAGDEEVRRLNQQFRQVDAPTDVLAFPATEGGDFVHAPEQPPYLGDVIISYPRAVAQAVTAGHSPETELALLTVHGTLHLLGHDHATAEDKAAMWTAQETILAELGFELGRQP
jgi:probable rRNA maturation factor